jgi:hypothetical protein
MEVSDMITGPIPTPAPPQDIPASASLSASPPPSEVVPQFIEPDESTAPDEIQEIQEASQAQVDENGPDTVVVRKPRYMRQRSRMQPPSEIVQEDSQSQEETPGEPGTTN